MSDNVYEMMWDCQFCGTKKNLGLTHRFCPNCGAPQNPDSRYFPSDDEKIAVQDHQFVGADLTCSSCGELNGAASEFCGQCGAPLSDAAKAKRLDEQRRGEGERFESSGSRDLVKEKFDAEMERVGVIDKGKKKGGINKMLVAGVVIVVLLIAAGIAAFTMTKEAELIVTDHEWERTIHLEEYRNFEVRDWRDSRPSGDNVTMVSGSCREEKRGTRRVEDGQTCETVRRDQGDGTFKEERQCTTNYREESVYDDKCTWTGQRWENISPAETSGGLDVTPYWASISLSCEGQSRVGCERESGRDEDYRVVLEDAEKEDYRCSFPQAEWEQIPIESLWVGEVRILIPGSIKCETLVRK